MLAKTKGVSVARTDNDSWEITESVGATALGVAAARAAETDSEKLPWPDGVTVYELDQPRVLEWKLSTLRDNGFAPARDLATVPVDLRDDWPAALEQAGFDRSAPSAWSAEGLLPFLPAAAQELLFERVQELGAPRSRIAVEAPGPDFLDEAALDKQRETMQRVRDLMAKLEPDRDIPDVQDLWYFEEREDVGECCAATAGR